MPPIPTTLGSEITNVVDAVRRRVFDLSKYQIPRLRDCHGPLATQQQYAAEVREDTELLSRQVEALDVAVEDERGERNRRELRQIVEELKGELSRLRKEARSALLASKRALDSQNRSNREELMQSSVLHEKQDLNEKVAEDALMKANNDVTATLQRTIGLMQGELERSVLSSQLLDASTANLRSASSTHDVLDGFMVTSKHLITALEKSDWLDRLLILASLLFFILVVLFILKQRLVDRSLRIAFWWTRFIPSLSSPPQDVALEAMEKGSADITSSASLVTTVVTGASIVSATLSSLPTVIFPTADHTRDITMDNTLSDILMAPSQPCDDPPTTATSASSVIQTTPRDEL